MSHSELSKCTKCNKRELTKEKKRKKKKSNPAFFIESQNILDGRQASPRDKGGRTGGERWTNKWLNPTTEKVKEIT